MGQSTISVRLDDTIKKQFDSLCAEFGMSASTAFNIYAVSYTHLTLPTKLEV